MVTDRSRKAGNTPASACSGKAAFPSAAAAHKALQHQTRRVHGIRRPSSGRGSVHPYRCEYCRSFHLGSTTT